MKKGRLVKSTQLEGAPNTKAGTIEATKYDGIGF
jgi:hypothetical protein